MYRDVWKWGCVVGEWGWWGRGCGYTKGCVSDLGLSGGVVGLLGGREVSGFRVSKGCNFVEAFDKDKMLFHMTSKGAITGLVGGVSLSVTVPNESGGTGCTLMCSQSAKRV